MSFTDSADTTAPAPPAPSFAQTLAQTAAKAMQGINQQIAGSRAAQAEQAPQQMASLEAPPQQQGPQPAPTGDDQAINPETGQDIADQMQVPYDPYRPASRRQSSEWGDNTWASTSFDMNPGLARTPYMPMPFEVYNIIRGGATRLGQFGGSTYAPYYALAGNNAMTMAPLLDALSGGKFSANFQRAKLGNLKIQQEEMLMNQQQALLGQQKFLQAAKEIFGQHQFHLLSDEEATNALRTLAMQNGHTTLAAKLNTLGLAGAQDYLEWEDGQFQDQLNAHTSLRKATGPSDAEKDRAWEGGGAAGTDAAPDRWGLKRLAADGTPLQQHGVTETAQPPDATQPPMSEDDQQIAQKYGLTARDMDAAHQIFRGEEPYGKGKEDIGPGIVKRNQIATAANDMRARFNAIVRKDGDEPLPVSGPGSVQDRIARIKKLDPQFGTDMEGIRDYKIDPKSITVQGGARKKALDAVMQLDPDYDQNNYDRAKEFTKGQVHRLLQRTNEVPADAINVMSEIENIRRKYGENAKLPANFIRSLVANKWDGDPTYQGLWTALRNYSAASSAIASGTGVVRPSLVDSLLRDTNVWSSPAQLRTILQTDMVQTLKIAHGYNQEWQSIRHNETTAPGLDPSAFRQMDVIARMNPWTGQMPADAPLELARFGQKIPGSVPSWAKGHTWEPLSRDDLDRFRHIYDQLPPDDPRRQQIIELTRPYTGLF